MITVVNPPPVLSDIDEVQVLTMGTAIDSIIFVNTGGSVAEFSDDSDDSNDGCALDITTGTTALPMGLSHARVVQDDGIFTCANTGTPSAVQVEAEYTIIARSAGGSDTATVSISVVASTP